MSLVAALSLVAVPSAQAASPEWKLTVTPNADYFLPGSEFGTEFLGVYKVEAENVGDTPTSGEISLENVLPGGLPAEAVAFTVRPKLKVLPRVSGLFYIEDFSSRLCPSTLECKFPGSLSAEYGVTGLDPGQRLDMFVLVATPAGLEGPLQDIARISGGGAPPAEASATNQASPDPLLAPRLLHFGASLTDSSAAPYTQAAGHPYRFRTEFNFGSFAARDAASTRAEVKAFNEGKITEQVWTQAGVAPVGDPRDVTVDLPPGLLANPQAVPRCALADFFTAHCEVNKVAVGNAALQLHNFSEGAYHTFESVFNLQPGGNYPGEFGIAVDEVPFIMISAGLRSSSDYGVTATSLAAQANLTKVLVDLWGVPADESHNGFRGKECDIGISSTPNLSSLAEMERECEESLGTGVGGGSAGYPPTPFLTMPTQCSGGPLTIVGRYDTWGQPGEYVRRSVQLPALDGCNQLHFEPTIEARPTTNLADAPSGLEFDLHVPQNHAGTAGKEDPNGLATANLKEAVVKLPQGLTINPASGNGLAGCSPAQIGLNTPVGQIPAHFTEEPAHCPDASKIGTAEVNTPLLHEPLGSIEPLPGRVGDVYLATPHQNPFGSLLAAYIVLEGEGVIIKLPGEIETNPVTGQVTSKFLENPQLPFEDFHLRFFGGARGDFRTPATCGTHEMTAVLTPYSAPESGPPAEASAEFEINNGGAPCARQASQQPNGPLFRAGTESPEAAKFTPFALKLVREDGSQEFSKIETTLPPGLVSSLAGLSECSEGQIAEARGYEHEGGGLEEVAHPSCPASSEVGKVEIASGAGPTPVYVSGHTYLAGPYKGAPLSLVTIAPIAAGPVDLGAGVVRSALFVDPETARITAVSDPLPQIRSGIPLDIRSVTLKMDRPNFTLNPTDCEELHFSGFETSVLDSAAPLSQRFQVGGCSTLRFKPKLSLSLKGRMTRGGTPALTAHLTMKGGEANIAKAQVTLPPTELVDNAHLRNVCTRAQFAEANCPADSVVGHARAVTPLLDNPLEGPVYLMTGFGHQLPDLAIDLGGQIPVFLHGKVDRGKGGGLRNTFEVVPDAPVSSFTLALAGAKKGLIENEGNLCAKPERATAEFTGQNGAVSLSEPLLRLKCPKARKGHHKHKRHRAG